MDALNYPSSNLVLEEQQSTISTLETNNDQEGIQPPIGSGAMVLYAAPEPRRIRIWPNLHSLFTVATLVNSVALLIFPNPLTVGINITLRCASIAFSAYAMNKTKISTDLFAIMAILIAKKTPVAAIALDLISEGINFSRCAVSCKLLKTQFSRLLPEPRQKKSGDISRLIPPLTKNPKNLEDACEILGVPLDRIDDQDFIEERYNSRNRTLFLKMKKESEARGSPFTQAVQEMIDQRDAAYRTLKERNTAYSK
ncbi:MAG: hypothetical protein K0S07_1077 [Chlamydiales bacterium]|nr:hypothetical protein [Chlamydiales bacterium]